MTYRVACKEFLVFSWEENFTLHSETSAEPCGVLDPCGGWRLRRGCRETPTLPTPLPRLEMEGTASPSVLGSPWKCSDRDGLAPTPRPNQSSRAVPRTNQKVGNKVPF